MSTGPKSGSAGSSGDWVSRLARLRKTSRSEPESRTRRADLMHQYLDPVVLAKIDDLELIARTVVEGFLHGLHRSPYVGFSVEFASHREYLPGDDLRHLNWKLFARNDKLYVKQYDAETNLDCHLLVDVSGSMETASTGLSKRRYATMLSAAIAHLAIEQRDAVGLTLFADSVIGHLKPRAKSKQLEDVITALAGSTGKPASATATVLHEVAELMPRRGLVVLISDLFFPTEDVFSGLDHLLFHGHDLIVFQLAGPARARLVGGRPGSLPGPRDRRRADHSDRRDPSALQASASGLAARAGRRTARPIGGPGAGDNRPAARAGSIRVSDATIPTLLIASTAWPVLVSFTWVFWPRRPR